MTDAVSRPSRSSSRRELADYLVAHGSPPDAVQVALIDETAALGAVVGDADRARAGRVPDAAHTRCSASRAAVEIGTFTGYSALCIARGLADGRPARCAATCPRSGRPIGSPRSGSGPASPTGSISASRPALDTLRGAPDAPRRSTSRSSTPTSRTTRSTTRRCCRGCARTG